MHAKRCSAGKGQQAVQLMDFVYLQVAPLVIMIKFWCFFVFFLNNTHWYLFMKHKKKFLRFHRNLFWSCFMNKVHYLFQLMFLPYKHQFFIMSWSRKAQYIYFHLTNFTLNPETDCIVKLLLNERLAVGFMTHIQFEIMRLTCFLVMCVYNLPQLPSSRTATSNECLQAAFHIQSFLVPEKKHFEHVFQAFQSKRFEKAVVEL